MTPQFPYQQAQARQNFMKAHDRPGCRNCTHGQEYPQAQAKLPNWKCVLGQFSTTAMAVCEKHVLKRSAR